MHLAMDRSTRIVILLVIDVVFFFVELIVGEGPMPHAIPRTSLTLHA